MPLLDMFLREYLGRESIPRKAEAPKPEQDYMFTNSATLVEQLYNYQLYRIMNREFEEQRVTYATRLLICMIY